MNALAATAQPSPAPAQATPQLRTLLLTDLVDSTGTVERLGDAPPPNCSAPTTGWCWNCSSAGAAA